MSSQLATRFPEAPGSVDSGPAARTERPVVPYALARLAVLFTALLVLSPGWVDLMGSLVITEPPEWGMRLAVIGGGAGLMLLAIAFLVLWVELVKRLARQD